VAGGGIAVDYAESRQYTEPLFVCVVMVAGAWQWDTAFMASTFSWKAALAVLVNATGVVRYMRRHI
jgi:hypothetical protein